MEKELLQEHLTLVQSRQLKNLKVIQTFLLEQNDMVEVITQGILSSILQFLVILVAECRCRILWVLVA